MSLPAEPRYLSAGDAGLVVELGTEIDAAVNDAVVALAAALEARALPGIREIVPTYRSLLVQYDPVTLARRDLIAAVGACWPPQPVAGSARTHWRVPVLYGGKAGEDLPAVAALHGLTEDEVVRIHSGASYRVYMLGFAPGSPTSADCPRAFTPAGAPTPGRRRRPAASPSAASRQRSRRRCRSRAAGTCWDARRCAPTTRPEAPCRSCSRLATSCASSPFPPSISTRSAPPRRREIPSPSGSPPMGDALRIIEPGPFSTVQDFGRLGWQRFGISASGALDVPSMMLANALAGNPPGTAVIETTATGPVILIEAQACRFGYAGMDARLLLNGVPVPAGRSIDCVAGDRISFRGGNGGMRGYIAVQGGFALAPVLGSLSTHTRSGIGGLSGRALRAGDVLPLAAASPAGPARGIPDVALRLPPHREVRVVPGPQDDFFTPEAMRIFLSETYTVSHRADRMGMQLDGPALTHAAGFNIVSDGIVNGSIQVPGHGRPVILLADRQTTGGYPKIATVIEPDLGLLAQMRPGTHLRFRALAPDEAEAAARVFQTGNSRTASPRSAKRPAHGHLLASERLLGLNLVGGVVGPAHEDGQHVLIGACHTMAQFAGARFGSDPRPAGNAPNNSLDRPGSHLTLYASARALYAGFRWTGSRARVVDEAGEAGAGTATWDESSLWMRLMRGRWVADRPVLAYGLAVGFSVLALALRILIDPMLAPGFPFLTFFPAVIITTFVCGLRPGILSAILCLLAAWYLFIEPRLFVRGAICCDNCARFLRVHRDGRHRADPRDAAGRRNGWSRSRESWRTCWPGRTSCSRSCSTAWRTTCSSSRPCC